MAMASVLTGYQPFCRTATLGATQRSLPSLLGVRKI
jgi:hypothetical protein